MKKYFLLLALLLIAALAAVGLHPEVLDGYKKGLYAKEISTSTGFFNEKIKTPVLAALKGGPDKGMQSGGLTPEELAALEGTGSDLDDPDAGTGVVKGGGDKPEAKDPDGGDTPAVTNPDDEPKVANTDPKNPSKADPEPVDDPDKPGTAETDGTPEKGDDPPGDKPEPGTTTTAGTDNTGKTPGKTTGKTPGKTPGITPGITPEKTPGTTADNTPDKTPAADPVKYIYDEFTAAGGVEFTGYSGVKTQHCWFNDISGYFDMPGGTPAGGSLKIIILTEELDCKDGGFTKVCRGSFLDVDNFQTATFTSASIKPIEGDDKFRVVGKLQIKDNTNPVGFDAVITQDEEDESATVFAEFKLDRQKYGLDYNGAAGYAISDEFSLKLELTGETE